MLQIHEQDRAFKMFLGKASARKDNRNTRFAKFRRIMDEPETCEFCSSLAYNTFVAETGRAPKGMFEFLLWLIENVDMLLKLFEDLFTQTDD